ncbi:MAG: DNA recombination protein RmuC [Ignavibacteriae bacterium]|nr:DNA recombination protein RmuC [Ignavibacteriota bacterium]
MDILFLLGGIILGAVIGWTIATQRARQGLVPRAELDAAAQNLNQTVTELRVEQERGRALATQREEALTSLREKENAVLALSSAASSREAELKAARQQAEETRAALAALGESFEKLRGDIEERNAQLAELRAQKQAADEKLTTQKSEIEAIRRQSEAEFKNLATQILDEKAEKFTALNKSNIETILKPLGDNLLEFKKKVEDVYDKEAQQRFSLGQEVEKLVKLNQQISLDATNLTKALEGNSKTQGDWGEMILERILEQSGLVKGREYVVQEFLRDDAGSVLKNEEGSKMQPDVLVSYPGDRKVIIDSKVSLLAYKRYAAADSREEQSAALKQHVDSIKRHIEGLSRKNYPDFTQSLDFVMMFVPIEPAFLAALQHDPELWNYAYSRRVLLMSPTNLIAALKLVADLWQREYQNRNAIEIAERGGALYDKFAGFVDTLASVGESIDKAQVRYTSAMNMLKDGKGNLLTRVEGLKKLGIKAKKALPSSLLISAEDEENADADNTDEESGAA